MTMPRWTTMTRITTTRITTTRITMASPPRAKFRETIGRAAGAAEASCEAVVVRRGRHGQEASR